MAALITGRMSVDACPQTPRTPTQHSACAWPCARQQVLGVPLLGSNRAASKLAVGLKPRIALLQGVGHVSVDDSLEAFLQHAGPLFGKDPSKWEQVGG